MLKQILIFLFPLLSVSRGNRGKVCSSHLKNLNHNSNICAFKVCYFSGAFNCIIGILLFISKIEACQKKKKQTLRVGQKHFCCCCSYGEFNIIYIFTAPVPSVQQQKYCLQSLINSDCCHFAMSKIKYM